MQKKLIQTTAILSFLLLWFFLSLLKIIPIIGPIEVIKTFFILIFIKEPVMKRTLIEHSISSILRVIFGVLIAFIIAVPLGIILGWFKKTGLFFETIFEFLRPVPPIAWIPISILLFGVYGQIFIVFLGAFFPVLVVTAHTAANINKNFIDLAKIFNASQLQTIFKVVVPFSLPSIINGMRVGLGVAWMSIIAAEMISLSGSGLGYFTLVMYDVGNQAAMISGMVMIGIVGFLMNKIMIFIGEKIKYSGNKNDKD